MGVYASFFRCFLPHFAMYLKDSAQTFDSDQIDFLYEAESAMATDFRLYDQIRRLKQVVRKERLEKRMHHFLNPNLGQTIDEQEESNGLIDDFHELEWDLEVDD